MSFRKKVFTPLVLAILAISVFAGTASAHECFIFNRSDMGNLNATHSANWVEVFSLHDLFGLLSQFSADFGRNPLTEGQINWAAQQAADAGFPSDFVLFANEHLPGGVLPPGGGGNPTNGKGIDHIFDYLPTFLAIYDQAYNMTL